MNKIHRFCSLVIQDGRMFYPRMYTQNNCLSTHILGQNNFNLKVEALNCGYQSATLSDITAKNIHFFIAAAVGTTKLTNRSGMCCHM